MLIDENKFIQLSGEKELSYNNLLDLDAAVTITYETNSKKNICWTFCLSLILISLIECADPIMIKSLKKWNFLCENILLNDWSYPVYLT